MLIDEVEVYRQRIRRGNVARGSSHDIGSNGASVLIEDRLLFVPELRIIDDIIERALSRFFTDAIEDVASD